MTLRAMLGIAMPSAAVGIAAGLTVKIAPSEGGFMPDPHTPQDVISSDGDSTPVQLRPELAHLHPRHLHSAQA
jgi:hypothetical protein